MAARAEVAGRGRTWLTVLAAGWVLVVAVLLQGSSDLAVGLLIFHLVAFGGGALAWAVARRTESPAIVRVVVLGWALKMAGTVARYFVLEVVYGGAGDANRYADIGAVLAQRMRQGEFGRYAPQKQLLGTQFVEMFTGGMFVFTGKTVLGGFFLFSAIGFVGLFLIYRAVRIAAPEVDPKRFALLVFLMPSALFWPSSIGKESLMVFCIGLVTYGVARMFEQRSGGIATILVGLGASALVRPHITLLLGVSVLGASSITRSRTPRGELPVAKMIRLIVFLVVIAFTITVASSFFRVDNLDANNVSGVLQSTSERTSQGGSNFGGGGPAAYPLSVITVMFRPFPFEAGNLQAVIASLESTFFLVLFWQRRSGVRRALGRLRESGMLAFVTVYSLLFFYIYSSFGNFGLLARQRVQLYPLVVIFVCMVPTDGPRPPLLPWRRGRRSVAAPSAPGPSSTPTSQPIGASS